MLETDEHAKAKGLGIGAGTQRRHQLGYLEALKRVQGGAIGEIVAIASGRGVQHAAHDFE